jgi:hypothetical protein
MAEALFRPYQSLSHVGEILAAQVFQLPAFEQVPDTLLWVQLFPSPPRQDLADRTCTSPQSPTGRVS